MNWQSRVSQDEDIFQENQLPFWPRSCCQIAESTGAATAKAKLTFLLISCQDFSAVWS